jgi:myosin I
MKEDFHKISAIHTQQGEPPNSVSRPTPKGKPIPPKPFTKGRLIRPGGPGGRPSKLSNTPRPAASAQSRPSAVSQARPTPQQAVAATIPSHTRNQSSTSSNRAVPPPPPPAAPPAKASEPRYRALYDFEGQSANELTLKKDDLITIIQKESNGKRSNSIQRQSRYKLLTEF